MLKKTTRRTLFRIYQTISLVCCIVLMVFVWVSFDNSIKSYDPEAERLTLEARKAYGNLKKAYYNMLYELQSPYPIDVQLADSRLDFKRVLTVPSMMEGLEFITEDIEKDSYLDPQFYSFVKTVIKINEPYYKSYQKSRGWVIFKVYLFLFMTVLSLSICFLAGNKMLFVWIEKKFFMRERDWEEKQFRCATKMS